MTWREGYEQWLKNRKDVYYFGWSVPDIETAKESRAFLEGAKWAANEIWDVQQYRSACECSDDVVQFQKRLEAE